MKEWVSRGEISEAEAAHLQSLLNRSSGGFFLGGNLYHDRTPFVYEIKYDPVRSAPGISSVHMGEVRFRGMANAFQRLTMGIDPNLVEEILRSKFWTGGEDRFRELIQRYTWLPPSLPIRDAIDWVHASVYSTIKAMKFSSQPPTCGGPVELAVITTDRPFRWVEHKKLNVAIGGNSNG